MRRNLTPRKNTALPGWRLCSALLLALLFSLSARATTYYVNASNAVPVSPYTTWATAATNIQDAINTAGAGDTVLVTNGVYAYGGTVRASITNRVCLNKALTVQSVNGPWVTIIQGIGITNNLNAVRCAWLTNGATLTGFTLRWGDAAYSLDNQGGGVACYSNAVVANCVIYSNNASFGGGSYQGTLRNCAVLQNTCQSSGWCGTYDSALLNCTVVCNTNSNGTGCGMYGGSATNCIVYANGSSGNISGTLLNAVSYCCSPSGVPGGTGNFSTAPQLFSDNIHLLPGSPCIGAGTNPVTTGTDIFGQSWANPPSVGCAEWQPAPVTGLPAYAITNNPVGFTLKIAMSGTNPLACWWQENGTALQDNGHFTGTQTTNLLATGVLYSDAGNFQLVASNSYGMTTSAVATVVIHCADANGTNPVAPYLTWATAATNLQDADNIALPGEIVLATNGVYGSSGKSMDATITNRLAIDRAIIVQSVNGPAASVIQGNWNPTVTNGLSAIRCVWMTNGTALSGFTILGGATRAYSNLMNMSMTGGGIWGAAATNAVAYDCLILTNQASYLGGGAYQVTLNNCQLTGNTALNSGGGAYNCSLNNCIVTGNSAIQASGGGTMLGTSKNCALTFNYAPNYGGGAYEGNLVNCTVSGNTTGSGAFEGGGAVASATLTNCIIYGNIHHPALNTDTYSNYYSCSFNYCDTAPLPSGTGNLGTNPQLLPDGIHLTGTSPCLGAGITMANTLAGVDIDGQMWSNPPAMGCDQWQPAPLVAEQPVCQVLAAARALSFATAAAGQGPFTYCWYVNGALVQSGSHYGSASTTNLLVNQFDAPDAGTYQVVISNALGVVTSQVAQVTIHCANAAGTGPTAPYSTWATAATNIQAAVDAANPGDIVLVTNGTYAVGGRPYNGGTTNRVVVSQPITLLSMNGFTNTIIQGAWDPTATNGSAAVRCCLMVTNASLTGFTLQGGATQTGDNGGGGFNGGGSVNPGTGVFGTLATVNNCLITGNQAVDGGGVYGANVVNCLISSNNATTFGGGADGVFMTNCTVANNTTAFEGGGLYSLRNTSVANSIICYNYYKNSLGASDNDVSPGGTFNNSCCPTMALAGSGNLETDPLFVDTQYHLLVNSPCHGTGNAADSYGVDLEGDVWSNPPSMGVYEVNNADLVGPISATLQSPNTNLYAGQIGFYYGNTGGRVGTVSWSWGDGTISTNAGLSFIRFWTNSGNYTVNFTVYNNDNPGGISASLAVQVLPVLPVTLQTGSAIVGTNGFQFQFATQSNVTYTVQTATNLNPPVTWTTYQTLTGKGTNLQITVSNPTNTVQFFRVGSTAPIF